LWTQASVSLATRFRLSAVLGRNDTRLNAYLSEFRVLNSLQRKLKPPAYGKISKMKLKNRGRLQPTTAPRTNAGMASRNRSLGNVRTTLPRATKPITTTLNSKLPEMQPAIGLLLSVSIFNQNASNVSFFSSGSHFPSTIWIPHSVLPWLRQRPARGSSPSATRVVQGWQPIDG
jgi:hypothetical protein